jgi:AraC-like DNA-binding protein
MILLDQAGAGVSRSTVIRPARDLDPIIEHYWIQQPLVDVFGQVWRLVPDTNPYLIFVASPKNSSTCGPRCVVVGARSRFADVSMENRIFTCGVRLYPGVLPLLTQFPASDFTERSVNVADVFGARGIMLMDRLGGLRSATHAIEVMADFLRCQLAGGGHKRLPFHARNNRVRGLAAQLDMPVRTVHARFMRDVGLSPKRALRVERLHRVLGNCQKPSVNWAQAAAIGGFADQAHMIREFRDLLGESPTVWVTRGLPICSRQSHRVPG